MLPPRRSRPARITASAASIPASPQPSTLAASAASRPSSAAFSAARAARSPPFPSRPGRGTAAGLARHGRAGLADSLVHLRDLPDQIPEPLVLGHLPAGLLQLRAGFQVHRPRPPAHRAGQVPLRPVAGVIRGRARAVRLAALAAHLVQRAPAEIPDLS